MQDGNLRYRRDLYCIKEADMLTPRTLKWLSIEGCLGEDGASTRVSARSLFIYCNDGGAFHPKDSDAEAREIGCKCHRYSEQRSCTYDPVPRARVCLYNF